MQAHTLRWAVPVLSAVLAVAGAARAAEDVKGQVELPLAAYEGLLAARATPTGADRYVLGSARATVDVNDDTSVPVGTVQVQVAIEVVESSRILVPVLPPGTAVESASVDGKPVQLVPTPDGPAWAARDGGVHAMVLAYRVAAVGSPGGYTLAVPLPRAAAVELTATLPGTDLDAVVLPAVRLATTVAAGRTRVTASVPSGPGVQISWRPPARRVQAIGRAAYLGRLVGDAVVFTAELGLDGFSDRASIVPVLFRSATLSSLRVDGKDAPILIESERFATLVQGVGPHRVEVGFQVPVVRGSGPPRIDLDVLPIPVSRFELILPGDKELTVEPATPVSLRRTEQSTVATVFLPLAQRVSFTWSEAVPIEAEHELRSSASIHHAVHAEEGVLYVTALVEYEVSRGETHVIEFELPTGVQIDRVESTSGAVVDWLVGGSPRRLSVFLDRELRGPIALDLAYDRSLEGSPLEVPLLRAVGVQRQRGTVALLADAGMALRPLGESDAVEVGEDQLPPAVRERLKHAVAHTYKYLESPPRLVVEAAPPDRVPGRFDAQIDTLVSVGDATLIGSASVAVQVKSGQVFDLQLELSKGVKLLDLSAPSLRTHGVEAEGNSQIVKLEFTQGLEGQFRIELAYERILAEGEQEVRVPALDVRGAEVQQGRIAVEALSAIELRAGASDGLSPLDVRELPRQLVLKTTNPVLLAYKYQQADPSRGLTLALTRHQAIDVEEAVIDEAHYRTLFTSDGLRVTTCRFLVRNSRTQFLRLQLPEGAEVWSASVDGKPEKPALAGSATLGSQGPQVLLRIINQSEGFPVELTYASTSPGLGRSGRLEATLPRPDVLVSRSRWDVYLPAGLRYGEAQTNLEPLDVSGEAAGTLGSWTVTTAQPGAGGEPPRIVVPAVGHHLAFEKLYANRTSEDAWLRLEYRRGG